MNYTSKQAARYQWLRDKKIGCRMSVCALLFPPTSPNEIDTIIDRLIELGDNPSHSQWTEVIRKYEKERLISGDENASCVD